MQRCEIRYDITVRFIPLKPLIFKKFAVTLNGFYPQLRFYYDNTALLPAPGENECVLLEQAGYPLEKMGWEEFRTVLRALPCEPIRDRTRHRNTLKVFRTR